MGDISHLGDALDALEGLLVGSTALDILPPSPLLGIGLGVDITKSITVVDGLLLGRPLDNADFLRDKEVVVRSPTTTNTGRMEGPSDVVVNDTIVTDLCVELPATNNVEDQRSARNDALEIDRRIRAQLRALSVEQLGLQFEWVNSTRRGALNTGTGGSAPYGSFQFLVITSTYKMNRTESLSGGQS